MQGPSNILLKQMYENNPSLPDGTSFRDFYDSMQNKTPEQAFAERGLDFQNFKKFKW